MGGTSARGEMSAAQMREHVDALRAQHEIDQAAIAFVEAEGAADRHKIEHLEAALVSSRRIGAAVGILMATRRVTYDEGFDLLRVASQRGNQKVREIAEYVLLAGELPAST